MQVMATAWLMIELTGSAILTALVQTAVFLPMFLLSLPAGVLADVTDRRRLLVVALLTQAALVALLTVLLLADLAGPTALLFFTFVTGCCTALLSPAWNTTVADSVPRDELPQAITTGGDRLQRRARARAHAGRRGVRLRRQRLGVRHRGGHHAADVAVDPALAAKAASAVAPAGRALVGRHARGLALRAPLQSDPGAAAAHDGLQRRRLGAVGAAAGDRTAAARHRRGGLRPADRLPGRRRGRRRIVREPRAHAGSGWRCSSMSAA